MKVLVPAVIALGSGGAFENNLWAEVSKQPQDKPKQYSKQ